jgi:hypothetical protein
MIFKERGIMKKFFIVSIFIIFNVYLSFSYFIMTTIYIHKFGDINYEKEIIFDENNIKKIVFSFGVDKYRNRIEEKKVYFFNNTEDMLENTFGEFLKKSKVPYDYTLKVNNFKSYTLEENHKLKINFLNFNNVHKIFPTDDYYLYNLNYTLINPYSDNVKPQLEEMLNDKYKDEIDTFIERQKNLKLAGISLFAVFMGMGFGLNFASLVTVFLANGGVIPYTAPAALLFSGLGCATVSLTVGLPLWCVSSIKKKYTIDFTK